MLEEEAFYILHSGEIPEVALHSSLYYLAQDPEGPGISLEKEELYSLKESVVKRYREIILRDLAPMNRDKSLYRGVARCIANWQRLSKFCSQENWQIEGIRAEVGAALVLFVKQELADVKEKRRRSCVNCNINEIQNLIDDLQVSVETLPNGWQAICE